MQTTFATATRAGRRDDQVLAVIEMSLGTACLGKLSCASNFCIEATTGVCSVCHGVEMVTANASVIPAEMVEFSSCGNGADLEFVPDDVRFARFPVGVPDSSVGAATGCSVASPHPARRTENQWSVLVDLGPEALFEGRHMDTLLASHLMASIVALSGVE